MLLSFCIALIPSRPRQLQVFIVCKRLSSWNYWTYLLSLFSSRRCVQALCLLFKGVGDGPGRKGRKDHKSWNSPLSWVIEGSERWNTLQNSFRSQSNEWGCSTVPTQIFLSRKRFYSSRWPIRCGQIVHSSHKPKFATRYLNCVSSHKIMIVPDAITMYTEGHVRVVVSSSIQRFSNKMALRQII